MTCYRPLIRAEDTTRWVKAIDGHRYHPADVFSSNRLEQYDKQFRVGRWKYTPIPCGKCIGCRLDYSRDWANRGYLESLYYEQNYFITLTYDEKHLTIPQEMETSEGITYTDLEENEWKGILVPKEFKRFLNTLRKISKREFKHTGIRYIGCGEYGGKEKRPHYHLILFNCPLPIESFYKPRCSWNKDMYYQNEIIERAWPNGISNICEANWNTIAYTARYITKKVNGKESEEYYTMQGQIPEFLRSSTQPGIARQYYEDHKKEIYEKDKIMIVTKDGVQWSTPPKYFDRLLKKEDPEKMKWIKEQRRRKNINMLQAKADLTSLTRWEQFLVDMEYKEDQTTTLGRNKMDTLYSSRDRTK